MASDGIYGAAAADTSTEPLKKPDVSIIIGGKEIACNSFGAALTLGGVVLAFVAGVALGGSGGNTAPVPPAPAPYGQPAGPQTAMGSDDQVNTEDQHAIDAGEAGYELPLPNVAWAALPSSSTLMNRLAFGSCANQAFPQPFWDTLDSFDPQIYIMGGDNVYGDCLGHYSATPDADCDELLAAYRALDGHPSFRGIKSRLPMVQAWDDHDGGMNDRGAEFPAALQVDAKRYFMDFFALSGTDDPRNFREGLYHSYSYGPPGRVVQIILLDCRSFRSTLRPTDAPHTYAEGKEEYLPDPDPTKTMLGEPQWAWLEETLRQPAQLRLVLSSIQLVASGHGWERWGLLPTEAQRFYNLVDSTRAEGVVVLSGDRHIGGVYKMEDGHRAVTNGVIDGPYSVPYTIWDITSSALTVRISCVSHAYLMRISCARSLLAAHLCRPR